MGKKGEFKIPPISTLAGSTLTNYFEVLSKGRVEPRYFLKVFLTTLIVLIATPFHFLEKIVFRKRLKEFSFAKEPLFIIGHWRSGTTLLHNVLTKDPDAAYFTTYHSLFPNNLASKWIFKTFMKINMPDRRPSDNVKLDINYPQEDEFGLSNCQANAYYNFFYFPRNYAEFYEKSVRLRGLTIKEKDRLYSSYSEMLKKAVINSKGERLIVKNPVNTGRVRELLKMFPDAKFLFIYRNPITVFFSTQRFFYKLFPTLWLEEVDMKFLDELILDVYLRLMQDYEDQKKLIPKENLMEICFEDFEKQPMKMIKSIYVDLLKEDFSKTDKIFEEYFGTQKEHVKNKYKVEEAVVDQVKKKWEKFIKFYGYDVPEDITVGKSFETIHH